MMRFYVAEMASNEEPQKYMDVLQIPLLPRDHLFRFFTRPQLEILRQVNEHWNFYISYFLSRKDNIRHQHQLLNSRWRHPYEPDQSVKYQIISQSYRLPFRGRVKAAGQDTMVIQSKKDVPLHHFRVGIFNARTREWWEVPLNTHWLIATGNGSAPKIFCTDSIVVIKIDDKIVHRSVILVFSVQTRSLVFHEVFKGVEHVCLNEFESPHTLILFTND